jgi:hypothetical protein
VATREENSELASRRSTLSLSRGSGLARQLAAAFQRAHPPTPVPDLRDFMSWGILARCVCLWWSRQSSLFGVISAVRASIIPERRLWSATWSVHSHTGRRVDAHVHFSDDPVNGRRGVDVHCGARQSPEAVGSTVGGDGPSRRRRVLYFRSRPEFPAVGGPFHILDGLRPGGYIRRCPQHLGRDCHALVLCCPMACEQAIGFE